jgi:SAM-dependent methyltransferase
MASITSDRLTRSYDRYFATGGYERRYPRPNPATLDAVLVEIAAVGPRVIDFGCGAGRYTRPLLERSPARVIAYDLSEVALERLRRACAAPLAQGRLRPVGTSLEALAEAARSLAGVDLVLMLFGVLGHIPGRDERRRTLRALRRLLRPGGRLVVSVPNVRRRFRQEQAARRPGDGLEGGDITYTRRHAGESIDLYYHLYDRAELERELAACGFRPRTTRAESVLPERAVASSGLAAGLDRRLAAIAPLRWAYGFLTIAETAMAP